MSEAKGITKKQLRKITGARPYIISYLSECGRLPIVKESGGKGIPTMYHPDSIKVIKDHLAKTNRE